MHAERTFCYEWKKYEYLKTEKSAAKLCAIIADEFLLYHTEPILTAICFCLQKLWDEMKCCLAIRLWQMMMSSHLITIFMKERTNS